MTHLSQLGINLRLARKKRFPDDGLTEFALRLAVSRATLQKMEKGDLSVTIDKYYQAAEVLGLTEGFHQLLMLQPSLFDD